MEKATLMNHLKRVYSVFCNRKGNQFSPMILTGTTARQLIFTSVKMKSKSLVCLLQTEGKN